MIDPALIGQVDLADAEGLKGLEQTLREVVSARDTSAAAQIVAQLDQRLASQPDVANRFQSLLTELRAIAVPLLDDTDLVRIFSEHLVSILASSRLDLWEEVRARLMAISIAERDGIKQGLLTAIRANSESVGSGIIDTPQGPRPPTVGNWVRLYEGTIGRHATPEQREEFLANNPSITKVVPGDQQVVRRLIHLLDRLKTSSLTPEGMEEDIVVEDEAGALHVMSGGSTVALKQQPVPAVPATPIPPTPASLPPVARPVPPPPPVTAPTPPSLQSEARAVPTTAAGRPAAPLLGDASDEEEIRAVRATLDTPTTDVDFDGLLNQFIQQQSLTFNEPVMEKRFRMVIKSFLKGIRNARETTEQLVRPTKIGGLGYDASLAGNIVQAAGAIQPAVAIAPLPAAPSTPQLVTPDVPSAPRIPRAPTSPAMPPVRPVPTPATAPVTQRPPEPTYRPQPSPVVRRPDGRQPMTDIHVPSRLTGPVDELRTLTLGDFRRLGADTSRAADKLVEKIDLLAEESFAKRAEGTRAWRQSPLYQLYLAMGLESMEHGESVAAVISRRATSGRPYLSEHEFAAITELNQRLRL